MPSMQNLIFNLVFIRDVNLNDELMDVTDEI